MDLSNLLMQDTNPKPATVLPNRNSTDNNRHSADSTHLLGGRESDTESGFEDGSSSMSKSMNDEDGMTQSGLSSSTSLDNLCVDQLLVELKSVAIDWKTFRNVKTCSCAMPFEHYTKKVGLPAYIMYLFLSNTSGNTMHWKQFILLRITMSGFSVTLNLCH